MAKKKQLPKHHHVFLLTWITYHAEDEPERTEPPEMFNKAVYVTADDKKFAALISELRALNSEAAAIRDWAKICASHVHATFSTLAHGYTTITYLGWSKEVHPICKIVTKTVKTTVVEPA